MLEKEVEKRLVKRVKNEGGLCLKFTSPGNSGVPDRIVLLPVPEEHKEIVSKYVQFIEVKKPGEKPSTLQNWWLAKLNTLGFRAGYIDE